MSDGKIDHIMPLTVQLLRRSCAGPLNCVTYINLADHGLARIENLHVAPKLQTLNLRGNDVTLVQNLQACHHLWHLDVANNQVTNLDGLSKFVALGSLNLSLNNLAWPDLRHIRHMHILELNLHGNPKLDRDPYYRIHVIDCLPNVWMLDGRLITSAERIQVQHFFQDSSISKRPVRHKLPWNQFIPTSMKEIQVHGIYGSKTTHLMMKFPANGPLNVDTDCRRLMYMAYNLQEDLQIELQHRSPSCRNFLEKLLKYQSEDRERCNMLLLLLVAFLEFSIPHALLQDCLTITKLSDIIVDFDSLELFQLREDHLCRVLSLLLSAVKVDRDGQKDGGLYDKLYLCLYYTVAELIKRANVGCKKNNVPIDRTNPIYREYRSLLAAEVVQLLCIVPSFYNYLNREPSVNHLVTQATGNALIMEGVEALVERIHSTGGGSHQLIEEVSEYLVECIQRNTKKVLHKKISSKSSANFVLETPRALPKRPQCTPVFASKFLAVGQASPVGKLFSRPSAPTTFMPTAPTITPPPSSSAFTSRPALRPRPYTATPAPTTLHCSAQGGRRRVGSAGACRYPKQQEQWAPAKPPRLGDKVLLGPQNLAYIIAMPEYDVALLQMETVPAPNGSVVSFSRNANEHYAYMNMVHMDWDAQFKYWKPIGSVGDRITLQTLEMSCEMQPPPSSPTSSTSPRSVGDTDTETTHHPSPRDSNESLPRPISLRFREKLQLSQEKIIPLGMECREVEEKMLQQEHSHSNNQVLQGTAEKMKDRFEEEEEEEKKGEAEMRNTEECQDISPVDGSTCSSDVMTQCSSHEEQIVVAPNRVGSPKATLTELLSARMTADKKEVKPDESQEEDHTADESLFSCLRCAMETIKINNDVLSPRPHSAHRGHTERAVNDSMVKQVAEANTASTEQFDISSAMSSCPRQASSRPNTARSAPDSARSQADVKVLSLNLWPETGLYTDYQRERTKAWDKTLKRPKSSASVRSLDGVHSRASSAKSRGSMPVVTPSPSHPSHPPHRDPLGSPVLIQMGNHWLAGGRDLATWERVTNRMKTLHAPGWTEGTPSAMSRRPKSVGPYKYRQRGALTQRRAKSAVGPREKTYSYQEFSHPPPSPASIDFAPTDIIDQEGNGEPSYLHQAHQHNFASSPPVCPSSAAGGGVEGGTHRPSTPLYGAPKKPPSPLHMTVKFM